MEVSVLKIVLRRELSKSLHFIRRHMSKVSFRSSPRFLPFPSFSDRCGMGSGFFTADGPRTEAETDSLT